MIILVAAGQGTYVTDVRVLHFEAQSNSNKIIIKSKIANNLMNY